MVHSLAPVSCPSNAQVPRRWHSLVISTFNRWMIASTRLPILKKNSHTEHENEVTESPAEKRPNCFFRNKTKCLTICTSNDHFLKVTCVPTGRWSLQPYHPCLAFHCNLSGYASLHAKMNQTPLSAPLLLHRLLSELFSAAARSAENWNQAPSFSQVQLQARKQNRDLVVVVNHFSVESSLNHDNIILRPLSR